MAYHPQHSNEIGLTTSMVTAMNALVWVLNMKDADHWIAILVSSVTALYLIYRWRSHYLRDHRAGINVFAKAERQKTVRVAKSRRHLMESLEDAYVQRDWERFDMIIHTYHNHYLSDGQ
jgi:hypothetical protein